MARSFKLVTWQTTYTSGVGLPGQIWEMRSPLWIRDIQSENDMRAEAAKIAGLRGAFGFPILDDNQIFGVMTFFSRDVQVPDVDLLQLLISIGNQIAEFIKRKHAEEALLESEERYRDLFENANDLIQSVNSYGKFIYVNRAWCETLGYSEADIASLNMFEIIHPEYKQSCRQIFYRALAGEKIDNLQTAFLTKQGDKIIVEGNISCKFVDGKPVATRGIFRNITRRVAMETALRKQQEQTERLLLNILPETIANRLKKKPGNIAENFTDVSVLFADIVGFTQISSQLSAIQLVNLLNQIFSAFDRLSDYYGLEKIKTIGDAYMVVGGLPKRRLDHAHAIACMALDMQNAIKIFNHDNHQNFNIRIGIHSGAVVAGVIGIKKFTYDLWGDTVNVASRMESHGLVGKIQVSEATYNLLRDKFIFEERGEIEVKGKGKMTTYLLIGKQE
jgi:PAS domain S-box-containing protein